MISDHYATERRIYGDATANGMMQHAIYEHITGCGEIVRDDPALDAAGIFSVIQFLERLSALTHDR